jgi:hypothetical protein
MLLFPAIAKPGSAMPSIAKKLKPATREVTVRLDRFNMTEIPMMG